MTEASRQAAKKLIRKHTIWYNMTLLMGDEDDDYLTDALFERCNRRQEERLYLAAKRFVETYERYDKFDEIEEDADEEN